MGCSKLARWCCTARARRFGAPPRPRRTACAAARTPATDEVKLPGTSRSVSVVGLGTLAWGDPDQGFGSDFQEEQVKDMCNTAHEQGITLFDTAEVYGYASRRDLSCSECLVGRSAYRGSITGEQPTVASTYYTVPWSLLYGSSDSLGVHSMSEALDGTLQRLGVKQVDLYQVHFPPLALEPAALADAMCEVVKSGRARAVGVCNYDAEQLSQMGDLLAARGVPLSTHQFAYSLLQREPETNGMLELCKRMGVLPIAHTPLHGGLLTAAGLLRTSAEATRLRPVLKLLDLIGSLSGGRLVEQVALNYLICRGAVVLPGAKQLTEVWNNAGAMGWRLEENELEIIRERLVALEAAA